ncbi:MAG: outer membrane protein [Glaciecola sp.]|jgi:outer membrane protein
MKLLPTTFLSAILMLFSLCLSTKSFSQNKDSINVNEFTLSQAQAFAEVNHYKAINSDLDLKISKKKIWETTAIGLPQISGSASYRHSIDLEFEFPDEALTAPGNEFMSIFGADNVSQGKLEATQLLFDGTYIVGLQAAKTYYKLSENQKEKTLVELKADVASSYYLVLIAAENVEILKKNLSNLQQSLTETEALLKQGFVEETDLDQLNLLKSKLTTSLGSAKVSKDIAIKMLKLSIGMGLEKAIVLKDDLDAVVNQTTLDALVASNFNAGNNADLNIMATQRKLLDLDLKRYKMQRLPSLAAFYQYTNTAYQLEYDFYKNANWLDAQNVGISLSVPIWSSGSQGAKIKQAQFALMKIDNQVKYFESALALQHSNSIDQLKSKIESRNNAIKSNEIAQKIYDKTAVKHKEGLASSFELTQIKNQLLEAQGAYINSTFELLNAKVALDKLQNKL